jgi:two-component system NtrC family sensor kinase
MMQNMLEVIERMDGTINHLRIFSRDTSQEPGIPVQINDVIYSSLKMIQAQLTNHNIDLRLELAEDLPVITGHPHQLEQVIVNLLANARDALENVTDREKQIAVKTWVEEREEMLEGDEKDALIVVLEIKDNGAGMSEEAQAHVFEPFFTTKDADKGTGLGLSISYSIVRNHNGIITCDSTRGEGTTFRLELPVCDENLLNGQ